MISVGIIGASGFTGVELLRLCAGHPELDVVLATGDTQAGTPVAELYPSLAAAYPDLVFEPYDAGAVRRARPGVPVPAPRRVAGASCPSCATGSRWVVDLAADFRLHDAALYPQWYGEAHTAPELLAEFAYGLPELFRDRASPAPRRSPCPAATRRRRSSPWPRWCAAGLVEPTGHHRRRRLRRLRRRPAAQAQHHLLHGRRGLHRLRPARPPPHARDRAGVGERAGLRRRGAGAVHARTWRP